MYLISEYTWLMKGHHADGLLSWQTNLIPDWFHISLYQQRAMHIKKTTDIPLNELYYPTSSVKQR